MTRLMVAARDALALPARVRRLTRPGRLDPTSYPLWVAGAVVVGIGLAWLLPTRPFLGVGAVGGAVVVLMLLLRPMLLLGLVLAFGIVNLAFITGGERQLLGAMGGLDMNGIRLVGLVLGLGGLCLIDRRMVDRAVDGHGRWYLLFLVFAAGTLFIAASPLEGLRTLFKLAYPFLVFVAVRALVTSEKQLDTLGNWTLAAAAVLVFLVNPLVVLFGGYSADDSGYIRLDGLGIHHNPFSMYLVAMATLALARYAFRGQLRYLLLALGLGGWIVMTVTRISLGATLVSLTAMAVYASILRRNVKPVLAAALMAAAVAIPLTPMALDRTFGYVPTPAQLWALVQDPSAAFAAVTWSGREHIWPVLLGSFLASPWVGNGLGSSGAVLRSSFPSIYSDVPHNDYLRVMVETGTIGLVLLSLGLVVWWIASASVGMKARGVGREYAVAAVAILPAGALLAFTDNPIDYYSIFTQYAAFFCAAAIAARRLETAPAEYAAPAPAEGASP